MKHIKHDGNVTLDQVIDIARTMRERSMARTLAGTVKEMLGTCNSVGCTVNEQSPRDVQVGFCSCHWWTVFVCEHGVVPPLVLVTDRCTQTAVSRCTIFVRTSFVL